MYIKRAAEDVVKQITKQFGVLLITDPERFGELAQLKINIGTGAVACMANNLLPIDKKNWYVPVWMM